MQDALTEETVGLYKALVGHRRKVWSLNTRVTPNAVRRFALAVGDDNPAWWDEGARHAPPTFLYSGVNYGPWPDLTGGPMYRPQPVQMLWAGDKWRWSGPLSMDQPFEVDAEIIEMREIVREGRVASLLHRERIGFRTPQGEEFAHFVRSAVVFPRKPPSLPSPRPALSPDEIRRAAESYDAEPGRRRGADPRTWRSVAVGDRLEPIVKGPLNISSMVSFAMAWGAPLVPTNRMLRQWTNAHPDLIVRNALSGWDEAGDGLHWDPDIYGALGFDSGFDFGPQRISWAAHLCTDWCGDAGVLSELEIKLLSPNFLGDLTWFEGEVTGLRRDEKGRGQVDVKIEGRNQRGEISTAGRAVIQLPD